MYGPEIAQLLYNLALADDTSYYHSLRVGCFMKLFSATREGQKCLKQAWISRDEFLVTGLLHDIGKGTWPREILLSTQLYRDMDGETLKQTWGYRIEHPIESEQLILEYFRTTGNRFWQRIAEGVAAHHEDYDGRGYPRRLKGTDIPLLARVLHVFDTFVAKTEIRRYRKPVAKELVVEQMKQLIGLEFDPFWSEIILEFLEKTSPPSDLDDWLEQEIKRLS